MKIISTVKKEIISFINKCGYNNLDDSLFITLTLLLNQDVKYQNFKNRETTQPLPKKTQKCLIEVINYVTQNVLKTSYLNLRDFKFSETLKNIFFTRQCIWEKIKLLKVSNNRYKRVFRYLFKI